MIAKVQQVFEFVCHGCGQSLRMSGDSEDAVREVALQHDCADAKSQGWR